MLGDKIEYSIDKIICPMCDTDVGFNNKHGIVFTNGYPDKMCPQEFETYQERIVTVKENVLRYI